MLPQDTWYAADSACASADLILVIGSSLEVWPAASLPQMAVENGARLIIANYSSTPLDTRADVVLTQDVAESLPLLVNALKDDCA